jgi:hypothetical protein
MTPETKLNLSKALFEAYIHAENQVEAQKIKDIAYELGFLIDESLHETINLNS